MLIFKFLGSVTGSFHTCVLVGVGLLLTCCSSEQKPAPSRQQTNIILLMGDDHGWEETGYNGHPFLQTPVLDEMAASGLRLDNFTRSFRNFHHQNITEDDYSGSRAILDNQYKLIIDGETGSDRELFDVVNDPGEQHNLIDTQPEIAEKLEQELIKWQQSVLQSLTGADYLR